MYLGRQEKSYEYMVRHSLESFKPKKFKCGNNLYRVRVFQKGFLEGRTL